jgi:peptide/nickel transport system substrate-binding protein
MLNPIISNEGGANEIMAYIYDSLIIRDPETFEWLPSMAYSWEIRDVLEKDGERIEGYWDAKKQRFYPGQGEVTALRSEVREISAGKYEIRGKSYYGRLQNIHETVKITPDTRRSVAAPEAQKQVVFIFKIRKNIKWHDGYPFSVDDILFSYDIIQNPYTDAAHLRNYYRDIRKVEKLDSSTIRFQYRQPYFLSLSFCGGIPVVPRHRYHPERFKGDLKALAENFNQHPDNRKPMGTGPYIFERWKKGQQLVLKKNWDYWGRNAKLPYFSPMQPYLDEIQFIVINNTNAAIKELIGGNIDADFGVTPALWYDSRTTDAEFQKRFVRSRYLTPLYTYIGWNLKRAIFKDHRVRQALTYLIPKEKILNEIHQGLGKLVTGPFFVKGPVYDHTLPPRYYDPLKARELLREAGWVDHDGDGLRDKDGISFEFEYLIHNAKEYHQKIADIMKESLGEAGIRVNIRVIDWTVFAKTVSEGNFDAVRFAWGTGIDGDPFQIWHSSQAGRGGSNFIHFEDKEVDTLLEQARQMFDSVERWKLYRKLHQILYKKQPYTFLFSFDTLGFYHRKFRGVKFYSGGYNLNEWYIAARNIGEKGIVEEGEKKNRKSLKRERAELSK